MGSVTVCLKEKDQTINAYAKRLDTFKQVYKTSKAQLLDSDDTIIKLEKENAMLRSKLHSYSSETETRLEKEPKKEIIPKTKNKELSKTKSSNVLSNKPKKEKHFFEVTEEDLDEMLEKLTDYEDINTLSDEEFDKLMREANSMLTLYKELKEEAAITESKTIDSKEVDIWESIDENVNFDNKINIKYLTQYWDKFKSMKNVEIGETDFDINLKVLKTYTLIELKHCDEDKAHINNKPAISYLKITNTGDLYFFGCKQINAEIAVQALLDNHLKEVKNNE
jgi:hypothetical protein